MQSGPRLQALLSGRPELQVDARRFGQPDVLAGPSKSEHFGQCDVREEDDPHSVVHEACRVPEKVQVQ